MTDFMQHSLITTLHDFESMPPEDLEAVLTSVTHDYRIGLVLPVTAADMRAEPFSRIVGKLQGVPYIDQIVVVLGAAPQEADFWETKRAVAALGEQAAVLWTDGPRVTGLYQELMGLDLDVSVAGKGRSVWTAFGYLLADPNLKAFALHDCDIVTYERRMLARLCLPLAHPALNFEFCKAYYVRYTDRMHGRVVRLLVTPILRALRSVLGEDRFLVYLDSFRYPLSGEFSITSSLARSNRIPSDWGLEIGTLAEVYRNTSVKRVCQVDLCHQYEHKHQGLSLEDRDRGLMKMAHDILTTILRTLSSMGTVLNQGHLITLRSAFVRSAQDAIRQYHADALINGLSYDRDAEEQAVGGFAEQISAVADRYLNEPGGAEAIPNWTRVIAALPDFPQRLRDAVRADAQDYADRQ